MDSVALTQVIDFAQSEDRSKSNGLLQNDNRDTFAIDDTSSDDVGQVIDAVRTGMTLTSDEKSCLANSQGAKKKNRRVKFPDSSLVSGHMDPPDPWLHAANCTTDILVEAYKTSCDRHAVKPLPRLLSQLMAVNNFQDRNETLSLRGEKMDAKHCETLEEVLRRVQFRMIDMEATHLEDEGVIALFDMIEYYHSCTKLNISFNKNLGLRGWQACARMLKKTPCLEYLDARSCNLTEQTMATVGRSIRIGSHLTTLHLENSYLSGRLLLILVAAVKMNETLKEIFLADNRLMPSDGIQLGNMLKFNHKLQLLDIRNNHLQDVGISHLCDGLFEQNQDSGLNTLVLWNNQITYQAMTALSRAIISTKSLETLNLGHNNLTNEGMHRLKEGLLQNKSLLRLGIQACKITCEGAVALAEFLAESKRLLRIDVRENDIKTGGLMALALALKVNSTVTRIDVDKEAKRENGVKDYAETQKQQIDDINTYLQRNRDKARELEEAQQAEEREKQRLLLEEEAKRQQQEEEEAARKALEEAEEKARQKAEESKIEKQDEADSDDNKQRLPPDLDLDMESILSPRQQTLESPEFMPEEAFPIPEVELAVEAEEGITSHQKEEVKRPAGFSEPLPPLVTDNMLSPLSQSAPSPPLSPNARKFIISKVHEAKDTKLPISAPQKSNQSTNQDTNPTTTIPLAGDHRSSNVVITSDDRQNTNDDTNSSSQEQSSHSSDKGACHSPNSADDPHSNNNNKVMSHDSQCAVSVVTSSGDSSNNNTDSLSGKSGCATDVTSHECVADKQLETAGGNVVTEDSSSSGKLEKPSPSLHTSLTMNGMRTELASVLDSLNDVQGSVQKDAESAEEPDDFERELDAMLAQTHVIAPPLIE